MRILLVCPECPETFWSLRHALRIISRKALLKSMWFLGIRHRGRLYYWKLFWWSLFRRPQLFPPALTLAVQGFHFRKVFASC